MGISRVITNPRSRNDLCEEKILHDTTKRIRNRFETGLLWKADDVSLLESKTVALKRLDGTERKMDKELLIAKEYKTKIIGDEEKGYIRQLSEKEADKPGS